MQKRRIIQMLLAALLCTAGLASGADAQKLPPASAEKLPRWRGFNLLEKFIATQGNKPFAEEDFKLISSLGFDFVRLPMDYRVWIKDGDWTKFDESVLKEIDQAVAWGKQYGIHVCINFHRAPGYTVAKPAEKTSLWIDPETQRICALHWSTFAKRYKGIPNSELSFNLFNEPAGVDSAVYAAVASKMINAIRAEDPNRLIISDGLQWGTKPCRELIPMKVAQATRGYQPFEITHYKAPWVQGTDNMPVPRWPISKMNAFLYGSEKKDIASPITITGAFPASTTVRIRVNTVSAKSKLVIRADGKQILEKNFVCGAGTGEWKKAVYKAEWKIYQNVYDKDYQVVLTGPAKQIALENTEGDWMTFSEIGITLPGGKTEAVLPTVSQEWGMKHYPVQFDASNGRNPFHHGEMINRTWLWNSCIGPWQELESEKVGIMVGEWGAYNKTPHDVVLAWAENCLQNWKKAGWGWALWNFRGSFGVLDSERTDVKYEDFHGHKLDRKLLDLLEKY